MPDQALHHSQLLERSPPKKEQGWTRLCTRPLSSVAHHISTLLLTSRYLRNILSILSPLAHQACRRFINTQIELYLLKRIVVKHKEHYDLRNLLYSDQ